MTAAENYQLIENRAYSGIYLASYGGSSEIPPGDGTGVGIRYY